MDKPQKKQLEIEVASLREEVRALAEGNDDLIRAVSSHDTEDAIIREALSRLVEQPTYRYTFKDNYLVINVVKDSSIISESVSSGIGEVQLHDSVAVVNPNGTSKRILIDDFDRQIQELVEQNKRRLG